MADILTENLSGKAVMGSDGTKLGMLYNITMDMKSGELHDPLIQPNEQVSPGRVSFDQDDHERLRILVNRMQAVKDYIVVQRQIQDRFSMRILDAFAFIYEYHTDNEIASILLVKEKLTGEHAFRFDALKGAGMHVHTPGQGTVDKVLRTVGETGDRDVLSETDTRLIAAAFELDAALVTDGYVMQNIAEWLNVGVEVIAQDGIAEQRTWKFRCQGCGREFDEDKERCPIYGMELSRKDPA